jgi:hypothetical protein
MADLGLSEAIPGNAEKGRPVVLEPSSDTDTVAVSAVAIRSAVTVAVNCVPLTKFVANGEPFQSTTAVESNPVPLTVSVTCGPPAVVEDGSSEVIDSDCPAEFVGAAKSSATTK